MHSTGEANLSPSSAASLWQSSFEPLSTSLAVALVGPAVTNGGAPMGLEWTSEFLGNCSECTISALALHWYDTATNIGSFQSYFEGALARFPDYDLVISEFWGAGTDEEVEAFLKAVLPWMEGQDRITRYAAFGESRLGMLGPLATHARRRLQAAKAAQPKLPKLTHDLSHTQVTSRDGLSIVMGA